MTPGKNGMAASATMFVTSSGGEPGSLRRVADRMVGSPEIYGHKQREA